MIVLKVNLIFVIIMAIMHRCLIFVTFALAAKTANESVPQAAIALLLESRLTWMTSLDYHLKNNKSDVTLWSCSLSCTSNIVNKAHYILNSF